MKPPSSPKFMEQIDKYLHGKLDARQTIAFWEYLLEHPEEYDILKTSAALRKESLERKPSSPVIPLYRKHFMAITATLVSLAALLMVSLLIYQYAGVSTAAYSPLDETFDLLEMVHPKVSRSTYYSPEDIEAQMLHAFLLSVTGETGEALAILESIDTGGPYQKAVMFNKSVLFFNKGEAESLDRTLSRFVCKDMEEFSRLGSCYWLKTLHHASSGNYHAAFHYAEKTVNINGPYQSKARNTMEWLRSRF